MCPHCSQHEPEHLITGNYLQDNISAGKIGYNCAVPEKHFNCDKLSHSTAKGKVSAAEFLTDSYYSSLDFIFPAEFISRFVRKIILHFIDLL